MDGVGWGGVVFIWLSFLWPIIATTFVYALKGRSLQAVQKGKYWILSIAGGYALAYIAGLGARTIAMRAMFSSEVALITLLLVSLLLSAIVPFGVALYVAKKCS